MSQRDRERWRVAVGMGARIGVVTEPSARAALAILDGAPEDASTQERLAAALDVPPEVLADLLVLASDGGMSTPPTQRLSSLAQALLESKLRESPRTTRETTDDLPTLPIARAEGATPATVLPPDRATWRPNVPRRLGPYDLLEELGHGGMGIVFKARHGRLGTLAALKVLIAGEHASPEELERFQLEAAAVARMGKHPHIVAVHDFASEGGLTYYAMEFVEGQSLTRLLRERDLTPTEAARLMEKVARALHFAHSHKIIHRDLKPDNVVVRADGEPQVMDFGLAREVGGTGGRSIQGHAMGTPNYMAPEQARGEHDRCDARTDVYGLGGILYQILTGFPPHPGQSWPQVLVHILRGDIVAPRRVRPETPRDLETVCLKCLESDPEKRYPSADSLADDLARFQRGEPVTARPVSRAERAWRKAKKHWAILLPVASASVIALGFVAYALVTRAVNARALDVLVSAGDQKKQDQQAREALSLYEAAHALDPSDPKAREGLDWARKEAGEQEVYNSGGRAPLDQDWLPAAGLTDCWHTDESEPGIIVAESTASRPKKQALIVLMRWIPGDLRFEYEVAQEGEELHEMGCFLASDIRGWEFVDEGEVWGTGYLIGIGSDGNLRAKVLGLPALSPQIRPLYVQEQKGLVRGRGIWHRVRVERRDARIRAWVAVEGEEFGKPVIDFRDPNPIAGGDHAYLGLYKWEQRYRYRNIRVHVYGTQAREEARVRAEVGRSFLEYDRQDYAAHRGRLRAVFPELASEGHAGLRSEVMNLLERVPAVMQYTATPADIREELALSWEAWRWDSMKTGAGSGALVRALADDPQLLLSLVEAEANAPGLTDRRRGMSQDRYKEVFLELGRWEEALAHCSETGLGHEVDLTPGNALLGLGRWEEAMTAFERRSPAMRALIVADRGRLEDSEKFGVGRQEGLYARLIALTMAARGRRPTQLGEAERSSDPLLLAIEGMIAGAGGSRPAMLDAWTRQAALSSPLSAEAPRPRTSQPAIELGQYYGDALLAYLGGRGHAVHAERFRRCQPRAERQWVDLAMAIRAEEDGDRDEAERLYRCCLADEAGLQLPLEWAQEGLKRLGE